MTFYVVIFSKTPHNSYFLHILFSEQFRIDPYMGFVYNRKMKAILDFEKRQKIREKNYPKAYALLQETFKNYYEHQLAFVYFYLLMIVLEQNQEEKSLETLQCNV